MILARVIARSLGLARSLVVIATASVALTLAGFLTLFVSKDRVDSFVFYSSLGASSIATASPGEGEASEVEGLAVMRIHSMNPKRYVSQEVTIWQVSKSVSPEEFEDYLGGALVEGGLTDSGIAIDRTILTRVSLRVGDVVVVGADPDSGCRSVITGALTPKPGKGSVGGRGLVVAGPEACVAQSAEEVDASALDFDEPFGIPTASLAWEALVDAPAVALPTLAILAVSATFSAFVAIRSVAHLSRETAYTRELLAELGASRRRVRLTWSCMCAAGLLLTWAIAVAGGAAAAWLVAALRTEIWHFVMVWALGAAILIVSSVPAMRDRRQNRRESYGDSDTGRT